MPSAKCWYTPSGTRNCASCGPAIEPLGVSDLVLAQRFAMRFGRVLLVRRAIADMALDDDQRGPAAFPRGEIEGAQHFLLLIGVAHMQHVPAIAEEPRRHVLGKGDLGVALDRHAVGIVDPAELLELRDARRETRPRPRSPPSCSHRRTARRCASPPPPSQAG